MESVKKEIDSTIGSIKEEFQKNFNKNSYTHITGTANCLLKQSRDINYLKGQYGALNLLGNASFHICDYENAQKYFLESVHIAEKMKDDKSLAYGYNNIGIILFRLKQFSKALEFYEKALKLKLGTDDKAGISTSYNNIGLIYNNLGDYDKALEYFQKALDIDKETGNDYALSRELNNIGLAWKYKKDLKRSAESFEESYNVSVKAGYNKGMATALSNISNYHLDAGDAENALAKSLEGEKIATAIDSTNHLLNFYAIISEAYEKLNDNKNALEYFKKMSNLKDKVFSEESQTRIFEMQAKYESEKKEKEAELYRLQNEELSILNTTKDKFFRIIHHDLLNPFTAIHSTADFLDQYYEKMGEEKRKYYIGLILNSSERLLKLMDNLFSWVKTQSGEIEFKPEKIDLKEITERNLELLANNLDSKQVSAEIRFPKKCFVNSDRNMTDNIVRNLIVNAIKFSYPNGIVKISARANGNMMKLTVADKGTGMNKTDLSKLFKVSETFSTPGTGNEMGTGLGLILVKEFLDICKGSISVKSNPGKGSSFTIELPKYY
ncbi:MAG TPA: tetratricopeptide repeat-containing sensor histidine kinase [Clostridiales bacterium]|nr:tetratricopeptide repeat-containing sensor histidine kinase [Clostridiales bacterium]HQP70745.1 tetratricopeptide repeat-containing sensor histidine kinase [Clostridiales bacterium]